MLVKEVVFLMEVCAHSGSGLKNVQSFLTQLLKRRNSLKFGPCASSLDPRASIPKLCPSASTPIVDFCCPLPALGFSLSVTSGKWWVDPRHQSAPAEFVFPFSLRFGSSLPRALSSRFLMSLCSCALVCLWGREVWVIVNNSAPSLPSYPPPRFLTLSDLFFPVSFECGAELRSRHNLL